MDSIGLSDAMGSEINASAPSPSSALGAEISTAACSGENVNDLRAELMRPGSVRHRLCCANWTSGGQYFGVPCLSSFPKLI